eukprot:6332680-Amphidinium_carterae.1
MVRECTRPKKETKGDGKGKEGKGGKSGKDNKGRTKGDKNARQQDPSSSSTQNQGTPQAQEPPVQS